MKRIRRKNTEWEAWVTIAIWWEMGCTLPGICACIILLKIQNFISRDTQQAMLERMGGIATTGRYWWPPGRCARHRSKYCWKMAVQCDKENVR